MCRRFESGLRYFLFGCFCLPCGVGCGGAVGKSFLKPPSPANPTSSLRHNEPIDRATHHRAWDPLAAPRALMVRSAVLLFGDVCRAIVVVDAAAVVWVVTRTASRTLRNYQKIARHPVSDAHRMADRTRSRQSRIKAQGFPYGALATRNPTKTLGIPADRSDGGAYR